MQLRMTVEQTPHRFPNVRDWPIIKKMNTIAELKELIKERFIGLTKQRRAPAYPQHVDF